MKDSVPPHTLQQILTSPFKVQFPRVKEVEVNDWPNLSEPVVGQNNIQELFVKMFRRSYWV